MSEIYYNKQNKKNLKTTVATVRELFDIEKIITKNPDLYQELCEKYPLKKDCIFIIQCIHPEVNNDDSKSSNETEEAPIVENNVENHTEIVDKIVENNVENSNPEDEEVNKWPEDFQPLYKVGEEITITYSHEEITENVLITDIKLSDDKSKYYYTFIVPGTDKQSTMAEEWLVDHEVVL